jgi:hypothetical protein
MALSSTTLTLLVGPTIAVPAPPSLLEALERVEVTTSDSGRSGFQLVFSAGRSGSADRRDYSLIGSGQLAQFNRVILTVNFGAAPQILMDGVITHLELSPGLTPGTGSLVVTGEDVSVMMDLEERIVEHTALDEASVATVLIGRYGTYGLVPSVTSPSTSDRPTAVQRIPRQRGTDLAHLNEMASRFGFVFYLVSGPGAGTNTAYWGPPVRSGPPQPALSVDLGVETNVEQISFRSDGLAPVKVVGRIYDRDTARTVDVQSQDSRRPALSARPDWQANLPNVRTRLFSETGLTGAQAMARAQGTAEASTDSVTATGTLDALRYGNLLTARGLVGLRGAGASNDGLYYVKRVTHRIQRGEYRQNFVLTRDGSGSTLSAVST